MQIKDYLIAIVVFGIMIMASTMLLADLANEYGVTVDQSFADRYNTLSNMESTAQKLRGSITDNGIKPGDFAGAVFEGIGGFFELIIQTITLPITLLKAAFTDLGLPDQAFWIVGAILTMITISIIILIISTIFKKNI